MRAPRGAQEVVKSRPPCEQRQRAAAVRAARWTAFSRASPPSSPRIQRANPMVWPPKSRQRCTHTADVSSAHRVHILRRTMSSHAAVGVAHSTGHWHDRHKLSRPRGAALGSFGTKDAIILLRFIASEALAIDFGASPKEFHPQWRRPLQHTTAGGGHSGPSGGSMPTRESFGATFYGPWPSRAASCCFLCQVFADPVGRCLGSLLSYLKCS